MGKETVVERTLSTLYLLWDLLVLLVSSEFVSDHTALTHTHTQTPILVVRRVKIILSIFAYLFSTLSVFPLISLVCSFCILIKILNCPHLWKLNVNTQKEQIKSRGKKICCHRRRRRCLASKTFMTVDVIWSLCMNILIWFNTILMHFKSIATPTTTTKTTKNNILRPYRSVDEAVRWSLLANSTGECL